MSVTQPYTSFPEPVGAKFRNQHAFSDGICSILNIVVITIVYPIEVLANVPQQTVRTTALLRSSLIKPRDIYGSCLSVAIIFTVGIDVANPSVAGKMSQYRIAGEQARGVPNLKSRICESLLKVPSAKNNWLIRNLPKHDEGTHTIL